MNILRTHEKCSALLAIIIMGVASPAYGGEVKPTPVPCWFFRGENLELQQTCTYQSNSWLGGGGSFLIWEDGVKTKMAWGLQARAGKPCEDTSVDGVCGVTYFRHPTTLKRISQAEKEKLKTESQRMIRCIEVQDKSICWLR
ncbi:hypothetical protein [Planktothrix mougeotii]|uniref:Uncharacterized protein n=1 Tax=Planktothrix mougeotii LEGE 06226 TaxID=1828728 RepID=A0ABR9UE00_9CYAN|nr:hypothetical protein [Planktothrix mougeotii]MBE9144061.1 hypothetical protein [Planktothrix mougeotii LEGE 06226]